MVVLTQRPRAHGAPVRLQSVPNSRHLGILEMTIEITAR